jgi:glycosidase
VWKYLIDSMLHWVRLGCDGFRCDVGDGVPIDFWVDAVTACQKVKPDLVMINEGAKVEWLEKAFDACYAWPWSFSIRNFLTPSLHGQVTAKNKTLDQKMPGVRDYESKIPEGALMFVFMDNHDTAADDWEDRFDRVHPVEAGNAAFVLLFLRRGLPLIFNGNEIADNSLNTFFAPVEDIARARKTVDWARALQPAGQKRLALIRALADLRHRDALFQDAPMDWVTDGEAKGAIAFTRRAGGRRAFVSANLTDKPVAFAPSGVALDPARKPILAEGFSLDAKGVNLGPWGYVAIEY